MALTYTVGDSPIETATFKVAGVLTDPTTVTATVVSPSGVTSNPTPGHPSTGTYTVTFDANESGDWFVRIAGTGAAKGAKETYVTVRRSEVPGSNLIAEALVTVADMRFFLDRTGMTPDMDETRWLEDLINSYSLACARYCNRQFTPERNGPGTRWPLQSDPVDPDGSSKSFTYDGNGYLSLAPYEARAVSAVVIGADLPSGQEVTLVNPGGSTEAEYRLEPAQKTTEGTYTWLVLPTHSYSHVSWMSRGLWSAGRQVKVTGDWGAPPGLIPTDVQHALKIAVGQAFRNPEEYAQRIAGGMSIDEVASATPGALPPAARALLLPYKRP